MEELVIIFVCLILNALLAAFEMAFVTVAKPQLRQMAKTGMQSARRLLFLRENPERTLSVIQIGITFVGMVSAAVGGAGAEESFAPIFEKRFGLSENGAEALAIVGVVLPLTLVSVLLGELLPKAIALRDPLRVSLSGARWIELADRTFSPLVSFLERATKFLIKLVPGRKNAHSADEPSAVELGDLSKQTQQYVLNLVAVETRTMREFMLPWPKVNIIQETDSLEQVTAATISFGHTRLPVCRDGRVVGILHTKEFIAMLATPSPDWRHMIRPAVQVRENELSFRALRLMQEKRSHLSIVTSESGQPLGIVTLEDIIEEIVGDIYDEDDDGRIKKVLASHPRLRPR